MQCYGKRKDAVNKKWKWVGIWLLMIGMLASCKPSGPTPTPTLPGKSLEWEKVADDWGAGGSYRYREPKPKMAIAANLTEADALSNELFPDHLNIVQNTNFADYLVVVIYQGEKGSTDYSIKVGDVRRDGNVITVYVEFLTPGPEIAPGQLVTSPYYVLKVKKTRELEGYFTFVLVTNDKELTRQPHSILWDNSGGEK